MFSQHHLIMLKPQKSYLIFTRMIKLTITNSVRPHHRSNCMVHTRASSGGSRTHQLKPWQLSTGQNGFIRKDNWCWIGPVSCGSKTQPLGVTKQGRSSQMRWWQCGWLVTGVCVGVQEPRWQGAFLDSGAVPEHVQAQASNQDQSPSAETARMGDGEYSGPHNSPADRSSAWISIFALRLIH